MLTKLTQRARQGRRLARASAACTRRITITVERAHRKSSTEPWLYSCLLVLVPYFTGNEAMSPNVASLWEMKMAPTGLGNPSPHNGNDATRPRVKSAGASPKQRQQRLSNLGPRPDTLRKHWSGSSCTLPGRLRAWAHCQLRLGERKQPAQSKSEQAHVTVEVRSL